jgi:hypothetical protein
MSHLDEGQLAALLDDELTPEQKRAVEMHLGECTECRALWEEIRSLAGEADRLIGTVEVPPASQARPPLAGRSPSPVVSRPLPYRTLAWAASVLLAVGLGYSLRSVSRVAPGAADRLATPAADQPALAERTDKSTAQPPAAQPTAPAVRRDEAPSTVDREMAKSATAPNAVAPAAPRPASPTATGGVASAPDAGTASLAQRSNEARDARAFGAPVSGGFRQVGMEEAVRTLAGSIRLVDGLEPIRVLAAPGSLIGSPTPGREVIRVVYQDPPGRELWLDQQRATSPSESDGGRLTDALLPGDTLVAQGEKGRQSIRWMDQHGFLLALTGYLPGDSLRAMIPRVR